MDNNFETFVENMKTICANLPTTALCYLIGVAETLAAVSHEKAVASDG